MQRRSASLSAKAIVWSTLTGSLDFATLQAGYRSAALTPRQVVAAVYRRMMARGADPAWTMIVPEEKAVAAAERLIASASPATHPLFGLPMAVKDSFDVEGLRPRKPAAPSRTSRRGPIRRCAGCSTPARS
jgi:hypothetical protein